MGGGVPLVGKFLREWYSSVNYRGIGVPGDEFSNLFRLRII